MRRRNSKPFRKDLLIGLSIGLLFLLIGLSIRKGSKDLPHEIVAMVVDEKAYVQWNSSENQIAQLNELYNPDTIKKEKNDISSIEKIDIVESNGSISFVLSSSSPITNVNLDKKGTSVNVEFSKVSVQQVLEYTKKKDGLVDSVKMSGNGKTNSVMNIVLSNSEINATLSLSEDRKVVTVNVIGNYVHGLSVGRDKEGDYIQIETVWEASIDVFAEEMLSTLAICLPYTTTELDIKASEYGTNILSISKENYNNLLIIKLKLESIPKYKIKVSNNIITIRLDDKEKGTEKNNVNKFGLWVVKKTDGLTLDHLTQNADVVNKQLTVVFEKKVNKQDFYLADGYEYEVLNHKKNDISVTQVIKRSFAIKDMVAEYNGEKTSFTLNFDDYLEFIYSEDKDYIYIKPVTPREKYKKIVVIDPGHGGELYPGAFYQNITEKTINLEYAMLLKSITEEQNDIKFYYLRTEDIDVSLDNRIAISNGINPDMFISMHCNANDYSYVKGTEVYYAATLFEKDKLSGKDLAQIVYDDLAKNLDSPGRGALETEDYRVVIKAAVPAILIEIGYMTNVDDIKNLSDTKFLIRAAKSLYSSIEKVFETYETR